jgi:hypothetical protein
MHRFPIVDYQRFSQLPLVDFDRFKFSVYILDFNWNYLFVNQFVSANLGVRGANLIGKNIWAQFPELASDPNFKLLKKNLENNIVTNLTTTSPVNSQRINISGYRLEDCFYCTASILPNRQDLMDELRKAIARK